MTSPCVEARDARLAMGTLVHVAASSSAGCDPVAAVEAAFAAIALTDRLMSFHAADSELTRLNRNASRQPQEVHPWTYAVLRRSLRIAALSEGLFDAAVAPPLIDAGLLPPISLAGVRTRATWRDLRLHPGSRVFYARPMLLDLGGIAKGFAVDQAIHVLRRHGCTEGVVNAGGDLRRFGSRFELVRVRTRDTLVPVAQLRCGAIATSGAGTAPRASLARPVGAIVDPRTGRLWRSRGGVSVAAPSCTVADALTKVAMIAGPACRPLLRRFGAQARWWTEEASEADFALP
jgi:FAD:protein FMN transferase